MPIWATMIPLVAVLIAGLAIVAGWRMRAHPVPAHASQGQATGLEPGFLKTTRGRIAVFLPFTLLLVGLWLRFDLSVAILPAVVLPIWVALFADQDLAPLAQRRLGVALLAAGLLFLATVVVGVAVFATR